MRKTKARIDLGNLGGYAIALVVTGIAIAMGSQLLVNIAATSTCIGSNASIPTACINTTNNALSGAATMGQQLPTIALIMALGVVVAMLVGAFAYFRRD